MRMGLSIPCAKPEKRFWSPDINEGLAPGFSNLTPFDTNWERGSGATPLTIQDLFFGGAISIPTAPTNISFIRNCLQVIGGARGRINRP